MACRLHLNKKLTWLTKLNLAIRTIKNINCFFLDYLGLLDRDIEYTIRNTDIKMIARGGTPDCKEIVVVMSGYEYRLDILPPMTKPIILDLGAHIGSFSLFAFHYYRMRCPKIYLFEPASNNFQYLKINMEINKIDEDRFALYQCAIGDYDGIAKLDKTKQNDAYRISANLVDNYDLCLVRTLPSLAKEICIEKIDILKMDIEAGEYDVLGHRESMQFLNEHVSFIILEYHEISQHKWSDFFKKHLQKEFDLFFEINNVIYLRNKSFHNIL